MIQSYKVKEFDKSFLEFGVTYDKLWPRMYYFLCLFHSILKERKKFGVIGWNKIYDFNNFDLAISLSYVGKYLDSYS